MYQTVRNMTRDQQPVTDEEIEALREEMRAQRVEIRRDLARDLGGEPEDYNIETYLTEGIKNRQGESGDG